MNYAIIGTGGIGGYYGSRLAQSGREIHFLLHRDYAFVKEHGLQIDSCDGSFHLDSLPFRFDSLNCTTFHDLDHAHFTSRVELWYDTSSWLVAVGGITLAALAGVLLLKSVRSATPSESMRGGHLADSSFALGRGCSRCKKVR